MNGRRVSKKLLRKQKKELRKLKRFLFPSVSQLLFSLTLSAVLIGTDHIHSPENIILIWTIILFTISAKDTIPQLYRTCVFFKSLKDPAFTDALLQDFNNAVTFDHVDSQEIKLGGLYLYRRSGFMRLGKQYVFGWKGAVPVRYKDILRIYEYRHWSEGYDRVKHLPRSLLYVSTQRSETLLGVIPSVSLRLFVSYILKMNPSIQYCTMKSSPFKHRVQYIPKDIDPNAYQSLFTQRSRKQ